MSTTIIDIREDQLSKLNYTSSIASKSEKRKNIRQKLQASLSRPVKARQKMSFILETTRGFFRIESEPLRLSQNYATVKGGHAIPLESILKVI
ncbi:hypothetical protein N9355_05130 [Crocinitomicaceae bacterium]|nr:hypothetical protein [Crocinitomicaceae bacterium]